jgi:predicted Zn-dependent peptidase
MRRLGARPVGQRELALARGRWTGELLRSFQTLHGTAALLRRLVLVGRPADAYRRWAAEVEALEPRCLAELARRHLRSDEVVVAAAGPASLLGARLPDALVIPGRPSRPEGS